MEHTEQFYRAHNLNPGKRGRRKGENRTLKKVQAGQGDRRWSWVGWWQGLERNGQEKSAKRSYEGKAFRREEVSKGPNAEKAARYAWRAPKRRVRLKHDIEEWDQKVIRLRDGQVGLGGLYMARRIGLTNHDFCFPTFPSLFNQQSTKLIIKWAHLTTFSQWTLGRSDLYPFWATASKS